MQIFFSMLLAVHIFFVKYCEGKVALYQFNTNFATEYVCFAMHGGIYFYITTESNNIL